MKIGIYCRVSGDKQRDNTSLPTQKELGIKFCEDMGFDYEVFSEVVSGGKEFEDRKMFQKLNQKILIGDIGGIWILDFSRGWRNDEYKWVFLNLLKSHNLKLYDRNGEVDYESKEGKLLIGVFSLMNDFVRSELVMKMNVAKKRRWREGKGLSNIGFGWKKVGSGELEVDETESEIVREIYNLYLRKDVKFFSDVEKRIVKKYGKIVNGKRLNGGLVERVLGKKKYKGIKTITDSDGEKYSFNVGRIVEDDVFDEVLKKKERMKSLRGVNMKEDYLLKGKVVCGSCNSNMWIKGGGKLDSKGNVYRYYYCNDKERKKKYDKKFDKYVIEENKRYRVERKFDLKEYEKKFGKFTQCNSVKGNVINRLNLEEIVWDGLYNFLSNSEQIREEYKVRYEKKLGKKDSFQSKLTYYDKRMNKVNERRRKMRNLYLDGEVTKEEFDDYILNEYEKEKEVVNKKIRGLEKELSSYKNKEDIDDWLDLMKSDLDKEYHFKRFNDRRRIVEKYIDWVSVEYLDENTDSKVYEIRMNIMLGNGVVNGVKLRGEQNKKSHQKNDDSNYKVKLDFVKGSDLLYKNVIHFLYTQQFELNKFDGSYIRINQYLL